MKFEDHDQAYSFVPNSKIVPYEEGVQDGYCKISPRIEDKIYKKKKLIKMEEQIRRGFIEIKADMARNKSERGATWMIQSKERATMSTLSSGKKDDRYRTPKKKCSGNKLKEASSVPILLNKDTIPSIENVCQPRNGVDICNGRESFSETQQHGELQLPSEDSGNKSKERSSDPILLNKDIFPSIDLLCQHQNGVDISNGVESYSKTQQHGDPQHPLEIHFLNSVPLEQGWKLNHRTSRN